MISQERKNEMIAKAESRNANRRMRAAEQKLDRAREGIEKLLESDNLPSFVRIRLTRILAKCDYSYDHSCDQDGLEE